MKKEEIAPTALTDGMDYSKFRAFEALKELSLPDRIEVMELFCPDCGIFNTEPRGCRCSFDILWPEELNHQGGA